MKDPQSEEDAMKLHILNLGELRVNCYVVETSPGRCVIIDLGGDTHHLMDFLENRRLRLRKILLTHGHFDHIGGVEDVRKMTGADVYIHEDDAKMLSSEKYSLAAGMSYCPFTPVTEYTAITGDSIINDGDLSFRVIHTPGHSEGSVCYICGDVIFSGDTLFRESVGRSDFPGSNSIDMNNSLRALSIFPGDYKVFPGHGPSTTLEHERRANPFMKNL